MIEDVCLLSSLNKVVASMAFCLCPGPLSFFSQPKISDHTYDAVSARLPILADCGSPLVTRVRI